MLESTERVYPSLHQLAIVLGIPYARLANAQVAYKPQVGKPYNKETNWDSVVAFIERRLDKTEFDSADAVLDAALEVEYTPKARRSANPNSVWGKILFGTTPMRKGHLAVGDTIKNKKTGLLGTIVFVNDTIVCYDAIMEDGTQVPTASVGNRVFNNQFEIVTAEEATDAE